MSPSPPVTAGSHIEEEMPHTWLSIGLRGKISRLFQKVICAHIFLGKKGMICYTT
jgi:hypothetical protein